MVIGDGPFLQGARFTVADIYLAMLASWSIDMAPEHCWWSNAVLARHYDAVLARPGCRRAVEQEQGPLSSGV
jgi:glutathione S-transferase